MVLMRQGSKLRFLDASCIAPIVIKTENMLPSRLGGAYLAANVGKVRFLRENSTGLAASDVSALRGSWSRGVSGNWGTGRLGHFLFVR